MHLLLLKWVDSHGGPWFFPWLSNLIGYILMSLLLFLDAFFSFFSAILKRILDSNSEIRSHVSRPKATSHSINDRTLLSVLPSGQRDYHQRSNIVEPSTLYDLGPPFPHKPWANAVFQRPPIRAKNTSSTPSLPSRPAQPTVAQVNYNPGGQACQALQALF